MGPWQLTTGSLPQFQSCQPLISLRHFRAPQRQDAWHNTEVSMRISPRSPLSHLFWFASWLITTTLML